MSHGCVLTSFSLMPGRAVTHSQIVNDDFGTEIAGKRFQMRVLTGKPAINENDVKTHPWLMLGDDLQMPRWAKLAMRDGSARHDPLRLASAYANIMGVQPR
jgi:hypothetical protein